MAKYYEKLGEMTPDNLVIGNDIPIHTASGTIKSGQGKLARGTVLALSSGTAGTGKLVILGTTAASDERLTAHSVLCDDIDATNADVVAEIYVSGQFNTGKLIVKSEYVISAEDVKALRDSGIYIESAVD